MNIVVLLINPNINPNYNLQQGANAGPRPFTRTVTWAVNGIAIAFATAASYQLKWAHNTVPTLKDIRAERFFWAQVYFAICFVALAVRFCMYVYNRIRI